MHTDDDTPTHEHCAAVLTAAVALHDDGLEL